MYIFNFNSDFNPYWGKYKIVSNNRNDASLHKLWRIVYYKCFNIIWNNFESYKKKSLNKMEKKILISSGLPANKNNQSGGGLYEIKLDGQSWKIKKVYSGTVHGVINYKEGFAISDSINAIILLDKNYNILKKSLPVD